MTLNMKTLARLCVVAIVTMFLSACGGGNKNSENQGGDKGVVLNRGNASEPNTLDPHLANGTWENNIIGDMLIGLYTEDSFARPVFGAAVSHEISEDRLVHTFEIRDDMTWSDGVPVTAHDFVFSLRRILNPETAAPYATLLQPIKNAAAVIEGKVAPSELGVRALGDKTLELTLEQPTPYLKTLLKHYTALPVPKHIVEQLGDDWVEPGNYISNGPFVLSEWRVNSRIQLLKNEKFYDAENVSIDVVNYLPLQDVSSAFRAFRAGEIDLNACSQCYPIQQVKLIDDIMPKAKRNEVSLSTGYIVFNTNIKPYDDIRVRKALGIAIDRDIITQRVMRAGEISAYSLTPPGIDNYVDNVPQMEEAALTQDERIAKAKALLADAGYDESNPLTITVTYRLAGDRKQIMIAMQDMWKRIGVNAKLDGKEPKVAYSDYRSQNFEVADAGWVADYNDPDNFLYLGKSSSGVMNYGSYNNPEFDRLTTEANIEPDMKKRAQLMAQAEQILLNDAPLVPIYFAVNRNLVGEHVMGWEDNVLGLQRTRWLSIDESKRVKY